MPDWPSTLPLPKQSSYKEVLPDLRLVSSTDSGISRVRLKATAGVAKISFSMFASKTQCATFETFYNTTTAGGTLEFTWTHPRTGVARTARFAPEQQPPNFGDVDYYANINVALEVMP